MGQPPGLVEPNLSTITSLNFDHIITFELQVTCTFRQSTFNGPLLNSEFQRGYITISKAGVFISVLQ